MSHTAILLMGPTASGKTDIAVKLCKRFPCDIISVDSALVYRGMDIGTAKPDAKTLERAPHRLIDIRDPEDSYSAGDFVRDARAAMQEIFAAGRIPLLAGGTMMYFRALSEGIAELPPADPVIREQIDELARESGWPAVHAELEKVDPDAAARINQNDSQRLQRALEVFRISGKALSEWQREGSAVPRDVRFLKIGLTIAPRSLLHARIAERLQRMLDGGFIDELRALRERPRVEQGSPAMRSVGYRQFWSYLDGEYDFDEARDRALFATRQLAKRQLTWLRSEKDVFEVDALEATAIDTISAFLAGNLD